MSPIRDEGLTLRNVLIYGGVVLLLLIIASYTMFQARFLLAGPTIAVYPTTTTVNKERVITLEGQVKNITTLTLNGRQIYTDRSGYFKEAVVLENGYTVVTLEAYDRYGRHTREARSFVYQPEQS